MVRKLIAFNDFILLLTYSGLSSKDRAQLIYYYYKYTWMYYFVMVI